MNLLPHTKAVERLTTQAYGPPTICLFHAEHTDVLVEVVRLCASLEEEGKKWHHERNFPH